MKESKAWKKTKKVFPLTSSQVLTEAKTAITSWMLSVSFTSIAFQSLLACPRDIGHIFHSTVKDWQWGGTGSSEVETERGKIVHLCRQWGKISCLWRISGWCSALHWIGRENNLGPVTFVLMAQWIGALKTARRKGRTSEVLIIEKEQSTGELVWVGLCRKITTELNQICGCYYENHHDRWDAAT